MAERGGFRLGTAVPIASLSLVAASHKQSTGLFVIAPCSNPTTKIKKEVIPKGTTSLWRREGDSNPRTGISRYTISNRAP